MVPGKWWVRSEARIVRQRLGSGSINAHSWHIRHCVIK